MRILDDPTYPFGCDWCDESFWVSEECYEHEATCEKKDLGLSGFQIEGEE